VTLMETLINICVIVLALIGVMTVVGLFVIGLMMFWDEK